MRTEWPGVDVEGHAYSASAVTDARGRYVIQAKAGIARLRLTKNGFTTSDRFVAVSAAHAAGLEIDRRSRQRARSRQTLEEAAGEIGQALGHDLPVPALIGSPAARRGLLPALARCRRLFAFHLRPHFPVSPSPGGRRPVR